jgi:hypothetical protein
LKSAVTSSRVAAFGWPLRRSSDRPKTGPPLCRLRVKHDAPDVLVTVEHVIIIIRPFAARSAFKQTQ